MRQREFTQAEIDQIIIDFDACDLQLNKIADMYSVKSDTIKTLLIKLGKFDDNRSAYFNVKKSIKTLKKLLDAYQKTMKPEIEKRCNEVVKELNDLVDELRSGRITREDFSRLKTPYKTKLNNLGSMIRKTAQASGVGKRIAAERRDLLKSHGITMAASYMDTPKPQLIKLKLEAENIILKYGTDHARIRKFLTNRIKRINDILNGSDLVPGLFEGCTKGQIKKMMELGTKPDSYFTGTGGSLHNNDAFIYCTDGGW